MGGQTKEHAVCPRDALLFLPSVPRIVCASNFLSSLHTSEFGSAGYGLVWATGRHGRYSLIGGVRAIVSLLTLYVQLRCVILGGSTEHSMPGVRHIYHPHSPLPSPPF